MQLAQISRYPVKAVGVEDLSSAVLEAGQRLPGDRHWAVAHEAARLGSDWSSCHNFVRGASSPGLMAITCESDGDMLSLHHPDQPGITVNLAEEGPALVAWLKPLCNPRRAAPVKVVRASTGLTDNPNPWISILNQASLDELSQKAGKPLARARFRANLWVSGASAWEEFAWPGKTIRIGEAELKVTERIERCTATMVDPETGITDTDTLDLLAKNWGHQDFGVFAEVTGPGKVKTGDTITVG